MSKVVREVGRALWIVLPLLVVAVFLLLPPQGASGTTYSDSEYDNTSSAPWCACADCGCERPSGWVVDARLGNGVTVSTCARRLGTRS
jgi:hypothetical protein